MKMEDENVDVCGRATGYLKSCGHAVILSIGLVFVKDRFKERFLGGIQGVAPFGQ